MPKETFYNLDEAKKKVIIDAATKEFTDNELHRARVSNIIKEAGIPRGSFYQYFEDIDDLYYYVIDAIFDRIFNDGFKYADLTDDLFEYTKLTFGVDYNAYSNEKRHKLMRNIFKSIGGNIEFISHHNNRRKEYISTILNKMDLTGFKEEYKGENLIQLYEFLQHIKRLTIQGSLMKDLSFDDAKSKLDWHIDIIKNGLLKEE